MNLTYFFCKGMKRFFNPRYRFWAWFPEPGNVMAQLALIYASYTL